MEKKKKKKKKNRMWELNDQMFLKISLFRKLAVSAYAGDEPKASPEN